MGAGASTAETETTITREQWREIAGEGVDADAIYDARADADGVFKHPLSVAATAARLAPRLGVPEATLVAALPGLNRCFERRMGAGKRIYKVLDLATLTTGFRAAADGTRFEAADDAGGLPSDVTDELKDALTAEDRDALAAAFGGMHKAGGYFTGIGQGIAFLHKFCEGQRPLEVSYDSGCRLFNMADPMPEKPPMDSMHNHKEFVADLAGKDMSSAVYGAMANVWKYGAAGKDAAAMNEAMTQSVAAHVGRLEEGGAAGGLVDPVERALRQPLIDCYYAFGAVGINAMKPDPTLAVDVMWEAMENLVFAGKVRSIGICNVTKLQVQAIVESPKTRIRPVAVQIEHHPWVMDEEGKYADLVDYCLGQGIAVVGHTPLCQGSRLETDERLRAAGSALTPAQAVIRFSLDRGCSLVPGAQSLDHIRENQATPLDVAAPELGPSAEPHSVAIGNMGPEWKKLCNPWYGGTLKLDEQDGHLYAASSDDADGNSAERRASVGQDAVKASEDLKNKLSAETANMFSQFKPVVDALPQKSNGTERRKVVAAALAELESKGDHTLAQMQVVPWQTFVGHGEIPRRSVKNDKNLHVSAASLGDDAKVIFISQRWLRRDHPDDEAGTKHKALQVAVEAWAKEQGVALDNVYIWFDLSCIDQDDFDELLRCVNALGLYIACSDALISFEHPEYWGRAWCLAEQMFGDAAQLPRFVLSADGKLTMVDAGALRQDLVDPATGALTVETDRPTIEVLKLVAEHLRNKLWLGAVSQLMSDDKLTELTDTAGKASAGQAEAIHGAARKSSPPVADAAEGGAEAEAGAGVVKPQPTAEVETAGAAAAEAAN